MTATPDRSVMATVTSTEYGVRVDIIPVQMRRMIRRPSGRHVLGEPERGYVVSLFDTDAEMYVGSYQYPADRVKDAIREAFKIAGKEIPA